MGSTRKNDLSKIGQEGDVATIEVKLFDTENVQCLDARNVVTFGLTGDGNLIDDQGTSPGSRKVELYNGRAIIRIKMNDGESNASVKSNGLPTVFCNLK
jgi:beta-galactosidase